MSSYFDLPRPSGLHSVPARMLDEQDADLDNLHQSTSPLLLVEIPDSQPSLKQVEISDSQPSFNQVEISDSQQARDSHERYLTHPKGFSGVHAHNDLNQIRDQLKLDFDNREAEPNQHKDHNSPGFVNEERAIPSGHHSDASPSEQRSRPSFQDQYPLHELDIGGNGRLPSEAPHYQLRDGEENMDEGATQPATQPFLDPRRQGTKSMLSDQDEADVLCILLPSSRPALQAVELVAKATPQHILQNHFEDDATDVDTQEDGTRKSGPTSKDIALRMTSKLRDPRLGFVFGRHPQRCDLVIGDASTAGKEKLSAAHFRIFLNTAGSLMIEDISTNGTFINKDLLYSGKNLPSHQRKPATHILFPGAMIGLPVLTKQEQESIRFIVQIPSRSEQGHDAYKENLAKYSLWLQQADRQAQVAARNNSGLPVPPLPPFNALRHRVEDHPNPDLLAASTNQYNHGAHWNGGETYTVIGHIGRGAFASVFRLQNKRHGEVFACKELQKSRFLKDGNFNQKGYLEVDIMKGLTHPNIVQYIECHETTLYIYIIMEYVKHGDLTQYTAVHMPMHEFMCQKMAGQIIDALDYLHKKGITHRDIKPDNILLASDNPEYVFKLSDFGLSKIVNNEDTFLKSFCGTLLYCAPEVYPGFQRAKAGLHPSKLTRSGEPSEGTLPYQPSVDIWSIGAVLYHLLCGHAPYSGNSDAHGAAMLMNIMENPPQWEQLKQSGISSNGISFVKRTLVIDPANRAHEEELLAHSWVGGPGAPGEDDGMEVTGGAAGLAESQSQLSQLNINPAQARTGLDYDDNEDQREAKRSKHHHGWASDYSDDATWQPFLGVNPAAAGPNRPAGVNRLFGEIGESALRSSGVLGENAHAALQVPMEESDLNTSAESQLSFNPNYAGNVNNTNIATRQQSLQYTQLLPEPGIVGAAPSLLGAEAMVGQLHMASPESAVSGPSADSKPASPKTPTSRDISPALTGSKRSSHGVKSAMADSTPKRVKTGQPKSSLPASTSATQDRPSTRISHAGPTAKETLGHIGSHKFTQSSASSHYNDAQHVRGPNISEGALLPTAFNSQSSVQSPAANVNTPSNPPSHNTSLPPDPSASATATSAALPANPPPTNTPTHNSAPSIFHFGTLTPTPTSIPTVPLITVKSRTTTFGRDFTFDFVHPIATDARVPKKALDITMYYPGIEKDIARGSTTWHLHPELVALVSTRTSNYIKVNGVHLMRGNGAVLYGELRTGDVVTVFGPPHGVKMAPGLKSEKLEFHCEFLVGKSKEPRSKRDPFVVKDGTENTKSHSKSTRDSGALATSAKNNTPLPQASDPTNKAKANAKPTSPASSTNDPRSTS